MKKIYLLTVLIFFCCVQITHAQPYPSIFGTEKTQFNIFEHFSPRNEVDLMGQTKIFYIEKDTVFEQQLYKKITQEQMLFNNQYYWGIREDTLEGKIFVYGKFFGEILTCDFSLSLGDTFFFAQYQLLPSISFSNILNRSNGFMIVDDIYIMQGRKVITFDGPYVVNENTVYKYNFEFFPKFAFIEGVGPNYGPLDLCGEERMLLCAYKDNDLVYMQREDLGCEYEDTGDSVNEVEFDKVKVIPNPVSNEFYIQSDLINIDEIFIYNFQGQCVSQIKLQEEFQKINIAALNTGIYLLKVRDTQGNIYSSKLIKL